MTANINNKFWVTWEKDGVKMDAVRSAENREAVEKFMAEHYYDCTNIYIRTMSGHLDECIRDYIQKVKIAEFEGYQADKWNDVRKYEIQQRLRCCADMALMLGENSQESLERTLSRAVDCNWEITGLDGHMFSFGFKSPAGFHGGIIFHCSAKEWSTHT